MVKQVNINLEEVHWSQLPESWSALLKEDWQSKTEGINQTAEVANEANVSADNERQRNDAQDESIEQNLKNVKAVERSVSSVSSQAAKNSKAISEIQSELSVVNGELVGNLDYAQSSVGGVVLLASAVNKLANQALPAAPANYSQSEEQQFRNRVFNSISSVVAAVNAIITSQQNSLQMAGGGGGSGAPIVIKSPESSSESVGLPKTWYAEFSGSGLSYQWYLNGNAVQGETSPQYFAGILNSGWNGSKVMCEAQNSEGTARTQEATLTMRPRIYLNTSVWNAFNTSGNATFTFKANGFVDITTTNGTTVDFDTWISPVNDPNMAPFDISQYQVKVSPLPSYLSKVGGAIQEDIYVDMTDGISITVSTDGLSNGESGYLTVFFRDKVMPDYNWAGWDNGDIFLRRV